MANEITITSGLAVVKSNIDFTTGIATKQATLTGSRYIRNVQAVGTTYEAVTIGDVSSAGYAYFKNLDSTNYVEIGREVSSAFYELVRIDAGMTAGPFKLATTSIFGRANTAAVNLEVTIFEA